MKIDTIIVCVISTFGIVSLNKLSNGRRNYKINNNDKFIFIADTSEYIIFKQCMSVMNNTVRNVYKNISFVNIQ